MRFLEDFMFCFQFLRSQCSFLFFPPLLFATFTLDICLRPSDLLKVRFSGFSPIENGRICIFKAHRFVFKRGTTEIHVSFFL